MRGYATLLLNAHMPFVRHPEERVNPAEERFFEAILERYLPLVMMLDQLSHDEVAGQMMVSVSAPLIAMLDDALLQERFVAHVQRRLMRGEREHILGQRLEAYNERYQRDLLGCLLEHHQEGSVELIPVAGTHPILPLLGSGRGQRAQLRAARRVFEARFGERPRGLWLPECAFEPGLDEMIGEEGLEYAVVETHGLTLASARPEHGAYAPLRGPSSGVHFFARHPLIRSHGPRPVGDGSVTAETVEQAQGFEQARSFVETLRGALLEQGTRQQDAHPIAVCPLDLGRMKGSGGLAFIEGALRGLAHSAELSAVALGDFLDAHPKQQEGVPGASSWGAQGYFGAWLNPTTDWLYRHLHRAEARMCALVDAFPDAEGRQRRALDAAARELMQAQSSEWSEWLSEGRRGEYALERVHAHLARFAALDEMLSLRSVDPARLVQIEASALQVEGLDHRCFLA